MTDQLEKRYFKIGLFVLSGIALLIALIIFFDNAPIFRKEILIETYFNESVQGLSIGSPVKYRGITIGHVKKIDFVSDEYDLPFKTENPEYRYIYVLMAITSSFLTDIPQDQLKASFARNVTNGLRIKMALQDLTGNAYLEINFTNPTQNPPLPISWKPKYNYIPSTVSIFTRFTDTVQQILQNIQSINFQAFFNHAQVLADNTNKVMKRTNDILASTQTDLIYTIKNANALIDRTNEILSISQGNIVNTLQNSSAVTNNMKQLTNTLRQNPASIIFNKPQVIDPNNL